MKIVMCEEVKNPEQSVQFSGYISDEYISAVESSEQRLYVNVSGPLNVLCITFIGADFF